MSGIEIVLEGGPSPAGIDREALIEDIQAEVDKISGKEKAKHVASKKKPPPPGAQGDWSSIHWLMDFITDPVMAKAYAKALITAIELILATRNAKADKSKKSATKENKKSKAKDQKSKSKDQKSKPREDDTPNGLRAKVTVLGKEIALPATTAAIEAFLKQLG